MIVSCGEALIDFLPVKDTEGRDSYHPKAGGSPYNVALTTGRLGAPTGFLGGISTDFFGDMLAAEFERSHVSLKYVGRSARPTTLAFVSLLHDEPQYAFFDENTAGRLHDPAEHTPIGPEVEALHFGSFVLATEPFASRLENVMQQNRGRRVICYDPNVRPTLINDRPAFEARVERFAHAADIIKISGADLEWLYRAHDVDGSSLQSRLSELLPTALGTKESRRQFSLESWDTIDFAWTNQRTHIRGVQFRIAYTQRINSFSKCIRKNSGDRLMHENTLYRNADLPRMIKTAFG